MFLGHLAVGLGAKRVAPAVSLGALTLAALWPDLLLPTMVLAGVETVRVAPGVTAVSPFDFVSYPWTHSLAATAGWALAVGGAWWLARRRLVESAVLGLVLLSHWLLDWVSHRPDLQLAPGDPSRFGLGLWDSRPATLAVEIALFATGCLIYLHATRARDRAGRWGFAALVAFLLAVYLLSVFSPPPPDAGAFAWGGQASWLLVLWALWVDRHRSPTSVAV